MLPSPAIVAVLKDFARSLESLKKDVQALRDDMKAYGGTSHSFQFVLNPEDIARIANQSGGGESDTESEASVQSAPATVSYDSV